MPYFNDTTGQQPTTYVVEVDAKAENFERINIPKGTFNIIEGGLLVRGATTGKAEPPTTDTANPPTTIVDNSYVYINFSNPNAPQTADTQVWNDAGGTRYSVALDAGGYAAIGSGSGSLRITLPFTSRYWVTADLATLAVQWPIILKREAWNAAVRPGEVKLGGATGAAIVGSTIPTVDTATAFIGGLRFGVVESFSPDRKKITFLFNSIGSK